MYLISELLYLSHYFEHNTTWTYCNIEHTINYGKLECLFTCDAVTWYRLDLHLYIGTPL